MAQGDFYINDILLPKNTMKPSKGHIDFTVTQRTVNNTLVSDKKGVKVTRKFTWENYLDEDFVEPMVALYLAGDPVSYREVNSDLSESAYTMRLSVPDEIVQEVLEGASYVYSGFSLVLEEV